MTLQIEGDQLLSSVCFVLVFIQQRLHDVKLQFSNLILLVACNSWRCKYELIIVVKFLPADTIRFVVLFSSGAQILQTIVLRAQDKTRPLRSLSTKEV